MAVPVEIVEKIVAAAVLAPSGDNSQPWRADVTSTSIRLWVDARRADSLSDVNRALTAVACGAAVENMVIRASALGYTASVTRCSDSGHPDLMCVVELAPGSPCPSELDEAISRRCTNRRLFRFRRIPRPVLDSMKKEAEEISGAGLFWMDTREQRSAALRLLRLAERERFRWEPLHHELFKSIRFDLGWSLTADEGLPPGALEVEMPFRPIFRALRHWPVMRLLNVIGVWRLLGWRVADLPCRFAPALGLLTVRSPAGFFEGGRSLQRLWLKATAAGLAMQPFAAAGILPLQLQTSAPAVPERVLQELRDRLAALSEGATGLLFVRLGWAGYPTVRSGRRDPRSFVILRSGAPGDGLPTR